MAPTPRAGTGRAPRPTCARPRNPRCSARPASSAGTMAPGASRRSTTAARSGSSPSRRGGPDVLRIHEEPLPTPKPGEVRIKVRAAGVAFADLLMREGLYPGTPPPPFTPGYDVAGVVESDAPGWRAGQHVVALTKFGGYAEYVCVPAESLVATPTGL